MVMNIKNTIYNMGCSMGTIILSKIVMYLWEHINLIAPDTYAN